MKRTFYLCMMGLVVLSLVLTACAAPTPTPKQVVKMVVATDATFPPFEIVDDATKELTGFDIELMKAIAVKGGFEIEFVNIAFDPMLAGLAQCQYDAGIAAITITDDRKAAMLFSDPYINAGQIVAVRKDETVIKSKDDLKGKTIGVQLGTTGALEAEKIEGAVIKTYDAYDLAFLDLQNGQVDAVIADYPTALNFVGKAPEKLTVTGEVFTDESYGIAVCKTKPEYIDLINKGLAAAKQDGTIQQLEQKWLAGQ